LAASRTCSVVVMSPVPTQNSECRRNSRISLAFGVLSRDRRIYERHAGSGPSRVASVRQDPNSVVPDAPSLVSERALLLPVNVRAERGQRVQACLRMIADQVDGPGADEDERCDHGDEGGADHNVSPFIFSGRAQSSSGDWGAAGGHEVNSDRHHTFRTRRVNSADTTSAVPQPVDGTEPWCGALNRRTSCGQNIGLRLLSLRSRI
jgi:hypothetical protein